MKKIVTCTFIILFIGIIRVKKVKLLEEKEFTSSTQRLITHRKGRYFFLSINRRKRNYQR